MANPGKRRGSRLELAVRDCLRRNGIVAHRLAQQGSLDEGDVRFGGWSVECKATAANDMSSAMNEAKKQAQTAGVDRYVVVKHRNRKPVEEAFAIIPFGMFVDMVIEGNLV